jgi:hypothetical protein
MFKINKNFLDENMGEIFVNHLLKPSAVREIAVTVMHIELHQRVRG